MSEPKIGIRRQDCIVCHGSGEMPDLEDSSRSVECEFCDPPASVDPPWQPVPHSLEYDLITHAMYHGELPAPYRICRQEP